jgi:hypothetical protein
MIAEVQGILATAELPGFESQRANELLTTAIKLVDHLLEQSPAAALGRKGGKTTAKRGSEYFRKIAAMRKEHKGGRPPKSTQ